MPVAPKWWLCLCSAHLALFYDIWWSSWCWQLMVLGRLKRSQKWSAVHSKNPYFHFQLLALHQQASNESGIARAHRRLIVVYAHGLDRPWMQAAMVRDQATDIGQFFCRPLYFLCCRHLRSNAHRAFSILLLLFSPRSWHSSVVLGTTMCGTASSTRSSIQCLAPELVDGAWKLGAKWPLQRCCVGSSIVSAFGAVWTSYIGLSSIHISLCPIDFRIVCHARF